MYPPIANTRQMPLNRSLTASVLLAVLLSAAFIGPGQVSASGTSWTIMIYMANDSSTPLPSVDNINAMEAAPQAPGTAILVLRDEPGSGNSQILEIVHDTAADQSGIVSQPVDDSGQVIGPTGEVNMASASTLTDFITFATSQWPANKYLLVLWGHGAGWDGLCIDGTDVLTLPELKDGLVSATQNIGRPLDMIAVDACVEATMETLYQVRGLAEYFVAAQTNVPYQGLPYNQFLTDLAADPEQSVPSLGESMVDDYIDWASHNSPGSATLSLVDLSKIGIVVNALSELSEQGLKYDSIFHSSLHAAMTNAEYYDTQWSFDFGDFLRILSSYSIPLEMKVFAAEAYVAYSDAILKFGKFDNPDPIDGVKVGNATGAVIYAPSTSLFDARYLDLDLSATPWDDFGSTARLLMSTNESASGPTVAYADTNGDEKNDQVTLTWSGAYQSVSAWVFLASDPGPTLVEKLESSSGSIVIGGFPGEITVAASASVNGSAVSYNELGLGLLGVSTIQATLTKNGAAIWEGYDVRLVSENLIDYANLSGEKYLIHLNVPTQVSAGQLVRIEVLDASGQVVADKEVFVFGTYITVDIEVPSKLPKGNADFNMLLLFSVLPGLFVLAYALMLYVDMRKRGLID